MKVKIHLAAFFTDKAPEYRAMHTRARTVNGMEKAAAYARGQLWAAYPGAVRIKSYLAADNSPLPADFMRPYTLDNSRQS